MAVMIKDLKHCDECTYQYGCSTYMAFKKIIEDFTRDRQIYERCGCPLVEIEEPKTGKWKVVEVLHGEWEGTKMYACDKCGEKVGVFKSNYCPNCGAKMEIEE